MQGLLALRCLQARHTEGQQLACVFKGDEPVPIQVGLVEEKLVEDGARAVSRVCRRLLRLKEICEERTLRHWLALLPSLVGPNLAQFCCGQTALRSR